MHSSHAALDVRKIHIQIMHVLGRSHARTTRPLSLNSVFQSVRTLLSAIAIAIFMILLGTELCSLSNMRLLDHGTHTALRIRAAVNLGKVTFEEIQEIANSAIQLTDRPRSLSALLHWALMGFSGTISRVLEQGSDEYGSQKSQVDSFIGSKID